ncbi:MULTISPECIES: hypothetical protein [Thermomonospora]|uniref:Uncharacterized protein n=1 Tax=Thermomonospora curvata (strain ATCC 19995 / DSM 43183 / JCM 3096 / KCTC 9072 / NBRC 15933 / NCIMB 10081 / Henssen B9) TaxID=471852 RepID=D1A1X4_THECD|nr:MULTISPECIES: hypothetical protein [Thermomonospora]ACY97812.1 hypothetical protein Tcur_2246 [Thermomonospora curvata DSM 43183]PKK14103.1 MAG: hypothetical protein BUE48_010985 [Thermomonospora sp. CIF 1]
MRGGALDEASGVLDSLVVLVAESLGYACHRLPGDVMALEGPTRLHVSMRNLRQLARLVPRDDWPALVSDHVTTIVTAIEEPLDLSDFELAQHLLRTRIYPAEADSPALAARSFAPGLIEVVVVDTPTTVRTVTVEEMRGWPVSGDALFMLGRANVRADGPLQADESHLGGVPVTVLHGWSFYAATHLAWLEEYVEMGTYGALVIAPNRSLIMAHPIRPRAGHRAAVAAVRELHLHARRAYEEGPGSLSPHLYWWHAGRLNLLEIRYEGGVPVLPRGFSNVLATLGADS